MFSLSLVLITKLLTTNLLVQAAPVENASTAPAPALAAPAPTRTITPQERGDIYMARKMYREAIDTYKQPPETAVLLNKIGIAYHQLADLDTAMRYYSRAVKLDPKYAEAINNRGTVYYARRSYRRAIGEYKKVLRLKPQSASTLANLANAYFQRKQYELASDAQLAALSLDPNIFESHSAVGSSVQDRNISDRAMYDYVLAKNYAKKGQKAEAILHIRRALEEGFKERDKFSQDPEFAGLRDDPEFKLLMTAEPKVL